MNKSNKLTGKDLVNVGIYTAIYFAIMMIAGFLGFIPIMIPLLTVICPLLGGIPFMLFLSKTKKFGMVTIFSILVGVLMAVAGMGIYVIGASIVFGIIADLIFKSGNYASGKKSVLGYAVFCIWIFGNEMPFFVNRAGQFEALAEGFGQEYADALTTIMPMWIAPVLIAACFGFGIVGAFIGKSVCKKHFIRAGIV